MTDDAEKAWREAGYPDGFDLIPTAEKDARRELARDYCATTCPTCKGKGHGHFCFRGYDAAGWALSRVTSPAVSDEVKAEVQRIRDMFPADNSHIFPPETGDRP